MKIYQVTYKPYLKLKILATLIDYGIYVILFYLYVTLVGQQKADGSWEVTSLPALPVFLFWVVYFVGLEALNQATPGHDIFKLKVVKTTGEKIGFIDAFKRRLCDPLDILMYGIPAMICIKKTDKHQRIGDLFAGTFVVKKDDITETELGLRQT